eukprot:g26539.t1
MIEFTLQFEREKLESDVTVSQLSKGNYKDMREELARVDWKGSLTEKTVQQHWREFLGEVTYTLDKGEPVDVICGRTGRVEELERLQKHLGRLGEWKKKWEMEYNVEKCEIMYFDRNNRGIDYFLNGERLRKSEAQRDLGILVKNSLKANMQ